MSDEILIASICPYAQHESRPLYAGDFHLPAEERGKPPFILRIRDHIQIERAPGMRDDIKRIIRKEDIANDLIQCWTTNSPFMTATAKPGIWITKFENPPQEEIAAAEQAQGQMAELLVSHVDAIPEEQRAKQLRNWPLPKVMGKWARLERQWMDDTRPEQRKPCPACRKTIEHDAWKCPHCQEIVDNEAYARREAERELLKRRILKEATKANLAETAA